MNDNKKNIVIILLIIIALSSIVVIATINYKTNDNKENKVNNSEKKKKSITFSKDDLIEDYYVTDFYENNKLYENKIFVPKYMTRKSDINSTIAIYNYKNDDYSISIDYNSYKTKESLEKNFIEEDKFEKESSYYYSETERYVKIYILNSYGYYQTIKINVYSKGMIEYTIDDSYKILVKNLSSSEKKISDYSIKKINGYYDDLINYNYYVDEKNKFSVSANYRVPTEKYGCNYDIDHPFQSLYLNNSNIGFYEGEIRGDDITTVKKQTLIRMYFSKIRNLDLRENAVGGLQNPINQSAFKNVTEDMVQIEIDKLQHENKEVQYYRVKSDNNNTYGERIYAYMPIKDDLYYIIQIIGGEGKMMDINMIKDFLPTNIEIK